MAEVTLKGKPIHTVSALPEINAKAPDFLLVKQDLSEASLMNYQAKIKVLNIFPSIDTPVCALSVKKFHEALAKRDDIIILNISKDLPFAYQRCCDAEGLKNVETLSAFRSFFGSDYGVEFSDGPLQGLLSRAVLVVDRANTIIYTEQVLEVSHEPDYDKVIEAIESIS